MEIPTAWKEALKESARQREEELLLKAIRRINGHILGLVLGLVIGISLFLATLWLVVKGSSEGQPVGAHLSLLNQFFPGYAVTLLGSFIGFFYGMLTGFLSGWCIGWVYNTIVGLKQRRA